MKTPTPADDRQLEDDLRALGEDEEPPFGWQGRVRAQIADRLAERRPRRRFSLWLPAAGLLAAALGAIFLLPRPTPVMPFLHVEVAAGPSVQRGGEARPGDRLELRGGTASARFAELRVYRDERELVLRCGNAPPCRRSPGELSAALRLTAPGRYRSLLLLSGRPLPAPAGDPETDAAAALASGAEVAEAPDVEVR